MTESLSPVLLDTNVVIDVGDGLDPMSLPDGALYISAITLAELSAGVAAGATNETRSARLRRLQWVESSFVPLPFDAEAARFYGHIHARVRANGRQPRRRLADLQIASVAGAHGWPLVTRNPSAFAGLDELVTIIAV
ncbi:type II toxin-antitoxin system VapC family toxin [Saccharomonospora iraqiensis]|uniref:type II toxin-antitoxin system VapC family toxin n=1 Tax=Saccharomonospora iraqiensis TaxID=52698 RepID=UPI000479A20C|nr:type II toxin-antitoxin system VapC family toxin [Saccharomonospora iraqiensis]